MIVVSDTTAITSLLQINQCDLLAQLYGDVVIPVAGQGSNRCTQDRAAHSGASKMLMLTLGSRDGARRDQCS